MNAQVGKCTHQYAVAVVRSMSAIVLLVVVMRVVMNVMAVAITCLMVSVFAWLWNV